MRTVDRRESNNQEQRQRSRARGEADVSLERPRRRLLLSVVCCSESFSLLHREQPSHTTSCGGHPHGEALERRFSEPACSGRRMYTGDHHPGCRHAATTSRRPLRVHSPLGALWTSKHSGTARGCMSRDACGITPCSPGPGFAHGSGRPEAEKCALSQAHPARAARVPSDSRQRGGISTRRSPGQQGRRRPG